MDKSYPPLANWQDFEELTVAYFEAAHGVFQPQRFGLQGHPQHGVDVLGQSGAGEWLAAQCKRLKGKAGRGGNGVGGAITEKLLRGEVAKADKYKGRIDRYLLVTTAPTQPEIQMLAQNMTAERQELGLFSVTALFWEDFERAFNRDHQLRDQFAYRLFKPLDPAKADLEILNFIAEAFRRRAFRDPLSVEHRDNFKAAIAAVLRALDTGVLINRERGVERRLGQGYAGLSDPDLRKQCRGLRDQLDAFNHMLLKAEKAGRVRQGTEWLEIDTDLYPALADARSACVTTLNQIIAPFGLEPI